MSDRDPRINLEPGDRLRRRDGSMVVVREVDYFSAGMRVTVELFNHGRRMAFEITEIGPWRDMARYFAVEAVAEHANEPEVVAPVLWRGEDGAWRVRQLQISGPLGRMRWADGGQPTEKELRSMAEELRRCS